MTPLEYKVCNRTHKSQVFYPDAYEAPCPAVLVLPDWAGCSDMTVHYAKALANCGYIAVAIDIYGEGSVGNNVEENLALMTPLKNDRAKLLAITQAGVNATKDITDVDAENIAVIGFCFGGLAALDLARAGTEIKAVCSFHGDLSPTQDFAKTTPKARILVQHGDADPMVSFESVARLRNELNQADALWELIVYSGTYHAFMNPGVDDLSMGIQYNERVAQKAWDKLQLFLLDTFNDSELSSCPNQCCD